jgi:putative ABC transport system permease protein
MMKALHFEVSDYDPLTFIAVPVVLTMVALVAILMPALAGMRVDPAVTLRAECPQMPRLSQRAMR